MALPLKVVRRGTLGGTHPIHWYKASYNQVLHELNNSILDTTLALIVYPKNRTLGSSGAVKWSAWSPSTPTIRDRNPLKPTVFSVNFVFEKNGNKQKEAGVGPFKKWNTSLGRSRIGPLNKLHVAHRRSKYFLNIATLKLIDKMFLASFRLPKGSMT